VATELWESCLPAQREHFNARGRRLEHPEWTATARTCDDTQSVARLFPLTPASDPVSDVVVVAFLVSAGAPHPRPQAHSLRTTRTMRCSMLAAHTPLGQRAVVAHDHGLHTRATRKTNSEKDRERGGREYWAHACGQYGDGHARLTVFAPPPAARPASRTAALSWCRPTSGAPPAEWR